MTKRVLRNVETFVVKIEWFHSADFLLKFQLKKFTMKI